MTNKINGIDVSESVLTATNNNIVYSQKVVDELQNDIKRLQEENKELKEMLSKEPKAMQAFQIAYSGLKKDNEVLWGMIKDYKTALEEIREVLEYYANSWINPLQYPDLHYNSKKAKDALLKINEVLNDRD